MLRMTKLWLGVAASVAVAIGWQDSSSMSRFQRNSWLVEIRYFRAT
jgi:hypothetical protein